MTRILLLVFLTLSCSSCNKTKTVRTLSDINMILTEWKDKQILIPNNLEDKNTLDSLLKKEYKILAFFDSIGCMECKLTLDEWDIKIRELKKQNNVSFIFIVNYHSNQAIEALCKRHRFNYPIIIDKHNSFMDLNNLHTEHKYQVFLLNRKNEIKLIGDPILNDKMWDLYKKHISN